MYPEIYTGKRDDFENVGIPLLDAYNVVVKKKINTAVWLSMQMKRTSKQWSLIKKEAVIKSEGQLYIIKIIGDGRDDSGKPWAKIEAKHIWWELCEKKHIPSAFFVGKSATTILGSVFSGISYGQNNVRLMSDSEVTALGLEPLTLATDIEIDKTNPLAVTAKIIDNLGGGEVYIDNFAFAFVTRIGSDTNLTYCCETNLKSIERTEETSKLVTRLYPYGDGSFEIDSANGGVDYIDSPDIDQYMYVHAGFIDYKDIKTAEALLQRAKREFADDNYNRIDKPKLSFKCSAIDTWKVFGDDNRADIGDSITIQDKQLDIIENVRIVGYDYYPYEPQKSTVTLGDPPKTLPEIIAAMSGLQQYYSMTESEVTEIELTENTHNQIIEVTKQEVVAVENIHATSAFIKDLFVERLSTNIINFTCIPNLYVDGGKLKWVDDEPTYTCSAPSEYGDIRPYIEAESIFMKFIEAHLAPVEDVTKITADQIEPLIISGKQMYYTSIIGGQDPYEYFTAATPKSKIPDIKPEIAELYKVYIRKAESSYVKMEINFYPIEVNDVTTFGVEVSLGAGDENGYGKMYLKKTNEGATLLYSSRTTGELLGFKITDEGSFHNNNENREWEFIGSGGTKDMPTFIIQDHQPTRDEFDSWDINTRIDVYDASSPVFTE